MGFCDFVAVGDVPDAFRDEISWEYREEDSQDEIQVLKNRPELRYSTSEIEVVIHNRTDLHFPVVTAYPSSAIQGYADFPNKNLQNEAEYESNKKFWGKYVLIRK